MPHWRRTHTCGELREQHVGQTVTLNGWVNTYRNQGAIVFVDLRDRYGVTQIVFEPEKKDLLAAAAELRSEFCIAVRGTVSRRLPGKENKDLATGAIEVGRRFFDEFHPVSEELRKILRRRQFLAERNRPQLVNRPIGHGYASHRRQHRSARRLCPAGTSRRPQT